MDITLFGCHAIQPAELLNVGGNTDAVSVAPTKTALSIVITLISRQSIPANCRPLINFDRGTIFVQVPSLRFPSGSPFSPAKTVPLKCLQHICGYESTIPVRSLKGARLRPLQHQPQPKCRGRSSCRDETGLHDLPIRQIQGNGSLKFFWRAPNHTDSINQALPWRHEILDQPKRVPLNRLSPINAIIMDCIFRG
jgi:hypothetical protein